MSDSTVRPINAIEHLDAIANLGSLSALLSHAIRLGSEKVMSQCLEQGLDLNCAIHAGDQYFVDRVAALRETLTALVSSEREHSQEVVIALRHDAPLDKAN